MILSEKWPAEPPPPFHYALRSPGPDLHLKHFPLIHSYQTGLAQEVGAETAPAPEFRGGHQTAIHRIPMHVAQFLDAFVFGPYVEVVEPLLSDMLRGDRRAPHFSRFLRSGPGGCPVSSSLRDYASRKAKFESLHHGRRSLYLRFADQQVNMFGHDHVTGHKKLIAPANLLQYSQQQVTTARRAEQRLSPITTASDEMKVSGAVIAL